MVLWKLDSYMQENETRLLSYTIYKNKLKWIKYLNIRPETIKLLEEKKGSKLFDISLNSIFFTFCICLLKQGQQKQK